MRCFDTPLVGLESIDEGTNLDQHDMSQHDETKPRTPHDSGDEPTVDDQETFPGAAQVKSTGSLDITFLVDDVCVPIKIQKIAGNNVFYGNLNDKALELFGPTIRTQCNSQYSTKKDVLIDHMVNLFSNTFNKKVVVNLAGKNLKYTRAQYRDKLQLDLKHEHPPMVPEKEQKALIEDAKENLLKRQGKKTQPGKARLPDTSKETKARVEKHRQHRLGQGGYRKLRARIGNRFQDVATEEDLNLSFKHGFKSVIEYQKSLGQTPISPMTQTQQQCNHNTESSSTLHVPTNVWVCISHDSGEQSGHYGLGDGNASHGQLLSSCMGEWIWGKDNDKVESNFESWAYLAFMLMQKDYRFLQVYRVWRFVCALCCWWQSRCQTVRSLYQGIM